MDRYAAAVHFCVWFLIHALYVVDAVSIVYGYWVFLFCFSLLFFFVLLYCRLIFLFSGIEKLLDVASELKEFNYESSIEITDNTQMTTAICLSKVYDTQYCDKDRQNFIDIVDEYIR